MKHTSTLLDSMKIFLSFVDSLDQYAGQILFFLVIKGYSVPHNGLSEKPLKVEAGLAFSWQELQ
jgi:hypothetical protein